MKTVKRCFQGLSVFFIGLCMCGFDSCGATPPTPGTISGGFPVTVMDQLAPTTLTSPHAGAVVQGTYLSDAESRAAGSTAPFNVVTNGDGNAFATNRRVFANWSSAILGKCGGETTFSSANFLDVQPLTGIGWTCVVEISGVDTELSTNFVRPSQLPATLTYTGTGLTTTNGAPSMLVYGKGFLASQVTASSVSPDGTSATFPFPKIGTNNLATGFYATTVVNSGAGGSLAYAGVNFLSMAKEDTSFVSPFGVAVAKKTTVVTQCINNLTAVTETASALPPKCTNQSTTTVTTYPVVSEYSLNQLHFNKKIVAVGLQPTAVVVYGTKLTGQVIGGGSVLTTQPPFALVANTGSNTLSVIDLINFASVATIPVGVQPVALATDSAGSKGWVANYGDGTVQEVDLATHSVTRSVSIGAAPCSLIYDASSNGLWVGGANFIKKVDLSGFTVSATVPVVGQVTSLGWSQAHGELVSTVVNGTSASAQEYDSVSHALVASYSTGATASFSAHTLSGTLPILPLLAAGTLVSLNYSNSISVSATPLGFTVLDLNTHRVIMQGATPSPVRSIASDPNQGIVYLAMPDSNLLMSVPVD